MTPQELADRLTGAEYPFRPDRTLMAEARATGLVVVYGASDDLMEFDGAIYDEISCYDGGTAYLLPTGLLENDCDNDDCPHFEKIKQAALTIEALWSKEGDYSWTYKTNIPHATFEVAEEGVPYCRGIVFSMADLKVTA
jgi:hypothetical protein